MSQAEALTGRVPSVRIPAHADIDRPSRLNATLWQLEAVSIWGKSRQAQIFTTRLHFGSNKKGKIRQVFWAMSCRINR